MVGYAIRRLALLIPTVLLIVFLTLWLVRLVPGDTIDLMMQENPIGSQAGADGRAGLEAAMGLDDPIPVQYVEYMGNAIRGDLGNSLWTTRPVTDLIMERLTVTLELAVLTLIISAVAGISLGVISGIRAGTVVDFLLRSIAIVGMSVPNFAVGVMVLVLPAIYFGWVPPVGYTPFTENPWVNITTLIIPSLILGLSISAGVMRFTRTMMLEVIAQDFVRTARAKGVRESTVVLKHVLRNALIPVVTLLGLQISTALGGSVIIEQLFALPGLGKLLLDAINQRDYPIVQGVTIVISFWVILVNLAIDLSYGFLDPRIRLGGGAA